MPNKISILMRQPLFAHITNVLHNPTICDKMKATEKRKNLLTI